MQISTRSPPPGFEPITDRLLVQTNDPNRDRQFREMAQPQSMYSWSKPFMPTVVKSEFFPPPAMSTWPPSPPGQEFLLGGYFTGSQQQQQFFQVPRSAGYLTPSPCSSDSSDKPGSVVYENLSRSYSPFHPPIQHLQPQQPTQPSTPHIWNPYSNPQIPVSYSFTDSSSAPTYLPTTAGFNSPVLKQENQLLSLFPEPPMTLPHFEETAEGSATDTAGPEKSKRKKRCKCPNCATGSNDCSDSKDRKKHVCHVEGCGKLYGKTSHLKAHLRWHVGERPFVCSHQSCGKTFTRSIL